MPKTPFFQTLISALLFVLMVTELSAQRDELFKITRNKDANEIIYHLNTDERGRLDLKKPIEAYWIRYDLEEEGRPLTTLERKYAYGLKFSNVTTDGGSFQFVSFDKPLFLVRTGKQQFEVQAEINGERMLLEEIYLSLGGGSFWFPKVNYVELRAKAANGEKITQRIEDL